MILNYSYGQYATNIGGVINSYSAVLSFNPCVNELTVEDGSPFKIGDTVLLIQMKGAITDTTNTVDFGNIKNYNNAGNYCINYIKEKKGNIIKLKNVLQRQFDIPIGKVQLIRVPYYKNAKIISTLSCLPWDGSKGGVLVLNVQDSIQFNADIDVSGQGFRGGMIENYYSPCHESDFFYNASSNQAANKGEGIFVVSNLFSKGRGKIANGGGGANGHNAGGGGGGNFGSGGQGGKEFVCVIPPQIENGGIGGSSLDYSNLQNRLFLGGGGGSGDENNDLGSSGANGGGIAIISSNFLSSNSFKIYNNGNTSASCVGFPSGDGVGGGGAGGSIFLNINSYLDSATIFINGGNGGNLNNTIYHGVGGGGGGGVLLINAAQLPSNFNLYNQGGLNGFQISSGETGGAQKGLPGGNIYNISLLTDTEPFLDLPNLNASKLNDINCNIITSQLNAKGAIQYSWSPASSLNNPNISNPIANPSITTKYIVTGKDYNGCINTDSVLVNVDFKSSGSYFIPNAFTPNNDGLNDCFKIKFWGTILEFEINIYNRWGEWVFHSTDPEACWDGNVRGVKQKADTFIYWIKAKTSCADQILKKGTLVLIR